MTTSEPVQKVTESSEVVQATPKTAQEWQALLDERFPEGAAVSLVSPSGQLSDVSYACPVLVVMAMHGEWPLIVGIAEDGRDVQLYPATWTDLDHDGHYAARVQQADVPQASPGVFEINSWLSEEQAAELATVRDAQREWLLQVADVAEPESVPEGESVTEPAESSEQPVPAAQL